MSINCYTNFILNLDDKSFSISTTKDKPANGAVGELKKIERILRENFVYRSTESQGSEHHKTNSVVLKELKAQSIAIYDGYINKLNWLWRLIRAIKDIFGMSDHIDKLQEHIITKIERKQSIPMTALWKSIPSAVFENEILPFLDDFSAFAQLNVTGKEQQEANNATTIHIKELGFGQRTEDLQIVSCQIELFITRFSDTTELQGQSNIKKLYWFKQAQCKTIYMLFLKREFYSNKFKEFRSWIKEQNFQEDQTMSFSKLQSALALNEAIHSGDYDDLRFLLRCGAAINGEELFAHGKPLHLAIKLNNKEMVEFLLDHGASLDVIPNEKIKITH